MIVLLLVFLGILYVIARFGFIFPAVEGEENYCLRLAWQRSAGQCGRMVGALFAAGFPIAVAQILLTFLLSNALLGVSPSEMLLTLPEPGAEMPAPIENREPPSIIAVLVFNVLAAVANFLSFAVLFSLLSLAFRACTGWVRSEEH